MSAAMMHATVVNVATSPTVHVVNPLTMACGEEEGESRG